MKTAYQGIDYGGGITNRNPKTGIRFGVILSRDVGQAWYDKSEGVYVYYCPHCGSGPLKKGQDAKRCPHCYKAIDPDRDWQDMEPCGYKYDADGYKCSQSNDDVDIFICESPYFTYAQLCSPCAPGAGYLKSELEEPSENHKAYCFGHDWFEEEKAPYTVYSVATGEEVKV
jgi:hypothetical protein